MGAPGTYDLPGATTGVSGQPGVPPTSIFTTKTVEGAKKAKKRRKGRSVAAAQKVTKLDPEAAAEAALGSTQGRIVSRQLAEAEQLMAREGPLYDELIKNTQLPIIEGAGVAARENTEAIRRAMAKGGSARREAFGAIQQMRQQEAINMQRGQALAQNRFKIDRWARENARSVVEFADNWAANTAGIRESYQSAMDKASELMLKDALPHMFSAVQKAAEWRYYAHEQNRNNVTRWVTGALGIGGMAFGVPGSAQLVAASLSSPTSPASPQYGQVNYAPPGEGGGTTGLIESGFELGRSLLGGGGGGGGAPTKGGGGIK
jgi:hypothetical protein